MSRIERSLWLLGAPLFFAAALGTPKTAQAQEACGDETCPKGFECASVPVPCPLIDCQSPEGCEDTCTPSERTTCVPLPCSSNADCAEDMVCVTREIPCVRATPACPPDGPCPEPAELDCAPESISQCVPRWSLPCSVDADCGDGFECVEVEECGCGSSAGAPGSGPSAAPTPGLPPESGASPGDDSRADVPPDPSFAAPTPPPDGERVPPERGGSDPICECSPSGVKSCRMIEQACTADTDCPSGWTCVDNPEGVCWSRPDGDTGCTPADPPKLCFPPYSGVGRDSLGGAAETDEAPAVPANASGSAPPPTPVADGNGTSRAAGCSITHGAQRGGGGTLLALFGAALSAYFVRRRR